MKYNWLAIKKKVFPGFFNTDDMLKLLSQKGIKVGKGTVFYDARNICIDYTRPCLLEIGEYCKITSGVIVLTHDYSRSVLRRVYGDILGEAKQTVIGNNVFLGMNSIVLMGTHIGNNVIVGAGSVVSGNIPDNVVVAGNPARVIRTLEEHYEIRKEKTKKEAVEYAKLLFETYGRAPTIKEMDSFYPLFLERDMKKVEENNLTIRLGGDNYDEIVDAYMKSKPIYNGYEDFLEKCGIPK